MIFQFTQLAGVYFVTSALLALLAVYVWQRRKSPGGLYFALMMAAGMIWALCNGLELAATDVTLKIIFAKLSYIGVVSIAPTWLSFNLAYSERSRVISRKVELLFWIVPLIVLAMVATNEWHHLIWTAITPVSSAAGAPLIYEHGLGILLNMAYAYTLVLGGTFLLIRTSLRTSTQFYQQTITLMIGALITPVGNILYFVWLKNLTGIDPTPFAIAATGLLFAWSMFRYRLFDLVPVARETLVTNMADAVLVIDEQERVIDMNVTARELIGAGQAPGAPTSEAFSHWPALAEACRGSREGSNEIEQVRPEGPRWFDTVVSPIRDNQGQRTGSLVVLRDITRRKEAEKALEDSWHNFRTLFDTVDDLLFVVDSSGKTLEVNDTFVQRLGYAREEIIGADISTLLVKADGGGPAFSMEKILAGEAEDGPKTLRAKDRSLIRVETHVAPGMWDGKPALFGVSRDITELFRKQEQLRLSYESLVAEINERSQAERQIASAAQQQEALLKEIHGQIRDNLKAVSTGTGAAAGEAAEVARDYENRIAAMELVHEKLYESNDLTYIESGDYMNSLIDRLQGIYGRPEVAISLEVESVLMDYDRAIPCGLIINELVSGSLKHAFPGGRAGTILVRFEASGDGYALTVADDGVSPGFFDTGTPERELVGTLVARIGGTLETDTRAGTRCTITFGVT